MKNEQVEKVIRNWMLLALEVCVLLALAAGCASAERRAVAVNTSAAGPAAGTQAYYERCIVSQYVIDGEKLVPIQGTAASGIWDAGVKAAWLEGPLLEIRDTNLLVVGRVVTNVSGAARTERCYVVVPLADKALQPTNAWLRVLAVADQSFRYTTESGMTGTLFGRREVREPTFEEYRRIYERDLASGGVGTAGEPQAGTQDSDRTAYIERMIQRRLEAMASQRASETQGKVVSLKDGGSGNNTLQPVANAAQAADKSWANSADMPRPVVTPAPAQSPTVSLRVGDAAPELVQGKYVQGEPLAAFERGKVYVVEFWATWCGPCRTVIPHVNALQEKYKEKGLIVIGQNVWQRGANVEGDVAAFVRGMGTDMTYRVALDRDNQMSETWMKAAGRGGIPCAFVVDRAGNIAWIGHPGSGLEEAVEKALAGAQ